jgi:hypothetical protein
MIRKVLQTLLLCCGAHAMHSAQHQAVIELSQKLGRLTINTPPPPQAPVNSPRVPNIHVKRREIDTMRKRTRSQSPEPTSPELSSPMTIAHRTKDNAPTRTNSSFSQATLSDAGE